MQLYGFPLSGNSRKVLMTVEETGLDYEFVTVDLMSGAQREADYLSLNPNGRVPTLVDGDLVLWESSAIMLYLAEQAPRAKLIPAGAPQRARMHQWLIWQPTTFNPPLQTLNAQLRGPEGQRDEAALTSARHAIMTNLDILSKGLGKQTWLADTFSLADIVMTPHLHALVGLEFAIPANLEVYLSRLRDRPSWRETLARAQS